MTRLTRRGFLGLAGSAGLATTLAGCGWLNRPSQTGGLLTSSAQLPRSFSVPLPIPAVAQRVSGDEAVDHYRIVAQPKDLEILPGLRTPMLTYQGSFPGPTIVSRAGRPTVVEHVNQLAIPHVVHLHGGHTPPESDGFPTDLIVPQGMSMPSGSMPSGSMPSGSMPSGSMPSGSMPGHTGDISAGSRSYRYPMQQRAATLWYHDHRIDFTGQSVYRGLAGFHLVRDEQDDATGLPTGDREIPLMITDRAFAADGSLIYPALDPSMLHTPGVQDDYMSGVLADVILVNGAPWPWAEVDAARYRLRVLNASNARRYQLRLDPPPPTGSPFVQVGSDGGLLRASVPTSS